MADFMIRFLICNLFISGMIGILLIVKQLLKNCLTSRLQYNLWFLLLGLLAVPFIPLRSIGLHQILSWLTTLKTSSSNTGNMAGTAHAYPSGVSNQINDFTVSVSRGTPSIIGMILCGICCCMNYSTTSIKMPTVII